MDLIWTYLYGAVALLIVGIVAVSGMLSMKYVFDKRKKNKDEELH